MASFGNSPNPWASSYDTYKDCSQGLCSIYCPQWCYLIFPPPPPAFGLDSGSGSGAGADAGDFSPLIIALVGILASAFILLSYYTVISKYCRRRQNDAVAAQNDNTAASLQEGLEEGLISSIRVYRYRKSDGFVDCTDCSVCLSGFQENEGLRVLPKCGHAFHVSCIDTWLKSNATCPLCRSDIANDVVSSSAAMALRQVVRSSEAVVVTVEERSELAVVSETDEGFRPKSPDSVRRSASMGCAGLCSDHRLLVADILRQDQDEDEDLEGRIENGVSFCGGSVGSSSNHDRGGDDEDEGDEQRCKWGRSGTLGLIRSPLAVRRTVSTGRFAFTKYG